MVKNFLVVVKMEQVRGPKLVMVVNMKFCVCVLCVVCVCGVCVCVRACVCACVCVCYYDCNVGANYTI